MDPRQGRTLIYLIIIGGYVAPCTASGVSVVSGISAGAAFDGMPSNVSQAMYRQLVHLLYCVRWNGSN